MKSMKNTRSYIFVSLFVFGLILLTGCKENKPPYFGAFFEKGGDFLEVPMYEAFGVPTPSELDNVPIAPNSQPVMILWMQDTNLQYLQFFSSDLEEELRYTATPKEDGIIELRPEDPLEPGKYCYIQGNPLGLFLPAWCFEVG